MKKEGEAQAPTEAAGKPEDLMAYKQCVFQLKNARASNPYTQCKARLGINQKTENSDYNYEAESKLYFAHSEGISFNQLKKKEMTIPKISAPKTAEIAPTIYPKKVKQVAHKAQINKPMKDPVPEHVKANKKQMAQKSEPLGKPVPPGVSPEKFDRCVDEVKAKQGKAVNAYAVCNASLGKSYNQLKKMETEELLRKPK
jgi:hypothetical protein